MWCRLAVASCICRLDVIRLFLDALAVEEGLEDVDKVLESCEVLLELSVDLVLVVTELGIEVLAVRASAHGGAEDGLDEEAVVGLEGDIVGSAEGGGKLLVSGGDIVGKTFASELETPRGLLVSIPFLLLLLEPSSPMFPYLTSQSRAWPALFSLAFCSLFTRSWRVSDSVGAARKRWRIF